MGVKHFLLFSIHYGHIFTAAQSSPGRRFGLNQSNYADAPCFSLHSEIACYSWFVVFVKSMEALPNVICIIVNINNI